MDRTVIVRLDPSAEQVAILRTTIEQHTACFNEVAAYGFVHREKNGIELHKATYSHLRAQYPDLGAQLVCAARVKATEAVASALTRLKNGRTVNHAPHSRACPIRYDARSYWVKWEMMTASLATVAGRLLIGFSVPEHAKKYIGGRVCSADLCYRKGHFSLHVVVEVKAPDFAPTPDVIGVDLGETHPAVMSNRVFLGQRRWKEQERRIFRLQRKLQSKGTKSAKRHLKKLSGKRLRQRKDHDHILSKHIVTHTRAGGILVFENLKDIRKTAHRRKKNTAARRRFHSWSFTQLFSLVEYKAEEAGIRVEKIDPRKTSQRCSRCGHIARNNRRSQSFFKCRHCGYSLNADLQASYNIAAQYTSDWQHASGGKTSAGGPCQEAQCLPGTSGGTSPQFLTEGT